MSEAKVDFLIRDELQYELKCRDIRGQDNETVSSLRKKLRQAISQKLPCRSKLQDDDVNLSDEIELVRNKISSINTSVGEINDESRLQDIVRVENKIIHTRCRVKNLIEQLTTEEEIKYIRNCESKLSELEDKIKSLNVQGNLKEKFIRRVSDSNEEEEKFCDNMSGEDVFSSSKGLEKKEEDVSVKVPGDKIVSYQEPKVQSKPCVTPPLFDWSMYNKLQNPVEKYLSSLSITDGLNIEELIKFIKIMHKMKRELKLVDQHIANLLVKYSAGPLLDKLLQCNEEGANIGEITGCILKFFIPFNMLENMRKEFVNRAQNFGEPLGLYISQIKEYSEILQCNYSESDLVNIIKMGLTPETRSKVTFCGNPQSFQELDGVCILVNNVDYTDKCRKGAPSNQAVDIPRHPRREVAVCYSCGRPGHLKRNCYRLGGNSHTKSSGFPKNL